MLAKWEYGAGGEEKNLITGQQSAIVCFKMKMGEIKYLLQWNK